MVRLQSMPCAFLTATCMCVGATPFALANPLDGVVVQGQALITQGQKKIDIVQQSNRAIINWRGFDIASDEHVEFRQPDSSSFILNRINSNAPSFIDGKVTANGNIVIVNQNGIVFGQNSKIDVNGLIATTADTDNAKFMKNNVLDFDKPGTETASIINKGQITAKEAGLVGLVAPNVMNSGVISAKLGRVQLSSGDTAIVDLYGDGLMNIAVSDAVKSQLVSNSGTIEADGGTIALTAAAGKTLVNSLIAQSGALQARSVAQKNGTIIISAQGTNAVPRNVAADKGQKRGQSKVIVEGRIDATGKGSGERGGSITVTADSVKLTATSQLDASGDRQGGAIEIGGGFRGEGETPTALTTTIDAGAVIKSDALAFGRGGDVAVWADQRTSFAGVISAQGGPDGGNGGVAEVSGAQQLDYRGFTDLRAPKGQIGTLTLDPGTIILCRSGDAGCSGALSLAGVTGDASTTSVDYLQDTTLSAALSGGNVSLTATNQFTDTSSVVVTATGAGALSLNAPNITLSGAYTLGTGDMTLTATGGGISMSGATITTSGGRVIMNQPVTLNANTLINTSAGNGNVTFNSTVNSAASTNYNLTVNAGTGTTTFNQIGATRPLGTLAVTGTLTSYGNVATSAGISVSGVYNNFINNSSIVASSGAINIGGAYQGYTNSTLTAPSVTISGNLGDGSGLKGLYINSPLITLGGSNFNLGYTTTTTFAGATTFSNTGTVSINSVAALNFQSSLTLNGATTIAYANPISFGGAITNNAGLTFNSNYLAASQTISQPISGAGGITKLGTNTLTLTGANSYSGTTTVSNGTLQIGNGGTTGALGSGAVTNNASLVFNRSDALTISNSIGGSGSLTKSGSNTVTFSGANTYSGTTNVNGGTLSLTGSWNSGAATQAISVVSGAAFNAAGAVTAGAFTLSGAGSVSLTGNNAIGSVSGTIGSITLNNTQSLSVGSLTTTGAIYLIANGTTSDITLNSGAAITSGASGNAIVLSAGRNFINNSGASALSSASGRWLIYSSAPSGNNFGNLNSNNVALWNGTYSTLGPASVSQSGHRYIFAFQPTLNFASINDSKIYGVDASAAIASDFSVSGFHNGANGAFLADNATTTYTGAPSVTSAGTSATASVAGGPYTLLLGSGSLSTLTGYALSLTSPGQLTVIPKTLNVTYTANEAGSVYGASRSALSGSVSASGFVNGDTLAGLGTASWTSVASSTSGVGTYAITGSGLGSSNYAIVAQQAAGNASAYSVTPRSITVSADAKTQTYGDSVPTLTYQVSNLVNGDTLSGNLATSATNTSSVGTYAITQGTLFAGNNYALTYNGANNVITPRSITVSADAKTQTYGDSVPTLTYQVSNLVNGDTLSGSLSTAATSTSSVGTYAITQGTLFAGNNYALTYNGANNVITPRSITVSADAKTQTYGDSVPTLTYQVSNLVNGDTLSGNLATSATSTSSVGTYAITQGNLAASANYALTYNGANNVITPRSITVSADAKTQTYGDSVPTLTYQVSNLVNGDTLSGNLATSATSTSSVGTYAITQGNLAASANYALTYNGANNVITPRAITVSADAKTQTYGDSVPTLTYQVSNLVNGDTLSGNLATSATITSSVGTYAITQGTLFAGNNYALTYNGANNTITPRSLLLSGTQIYNGTRTAWGSNLMATNLVNNDTIHIGGSAIMAQKDVGSHALTSLAGLTLDNGNYTLTNSAGVMHVNPKALTVSANHVTMRLGEAEPALTYVFSGLINADERPDFRGTLTRTMGEGVGAYGISRGSLTVTGNYTIGTFNPGVFNILGREISVATLPTTVLKESQTIFSLASSRVTPWINPAPIKSRAPMQMQSNKTSASDESTADQGSASSRVPDQGASAYESVVPAWLQIDPALVSTLSLN